VHRSSRPTRSCSDSVALPRDEAEHLTRVLRLAGRHGRGVRRAGREFSRRSASPAGAMWRAPRVAGGRCGRAGRGVDARAGGLKADKMDDLVATGDARRVDRPADRQQADRDDVAALTGPRVDRWRRVALASVKQSDAPCSRSPQAAQLRRLARRSVAGADADAVEPSAAADAGTLSFLRDRPTPVEAAIVVGRKRLDRAECQSARARASPRHDRQRVLRADAGRWRR